MLKVKGVKFWPSQIKGILQSFPELSQNYRVLVRSHRGVDVLELLVEGKAPPEGRLDLLLERLKRETLLGFNAVTFVETLGPGPLAVDERKGKTS
jgi:phenylacetate-CoA ligase